MLFSRILKEQKIDIVIYFLSILTGLFICCYYLATLKPNLFYESTNSDALYMASLYKDLFIDKNHLHGWNLNTTSLLFPNFVIFALYNFLFNDFIIAQLLHGLTQFLLLIIISNYFIFVIKPSIKLTTLSILNSIITLIPLSGIHLDNSIFTLLLILPYHIGAFLMTLLAITWIIKYFKNSRFKYLIYIWVITIIMTFSDRIFILFFSAAVFPILVILLFNKTFRKKAFILLINIIFSSICGLLILRAILLSYYIEYSPSDMFVWERIGSSFKIMTRQYLEILFENSIKGFLFKLIVLILIYNLYYVFKNLKNFILDNNFNIIYFSLLYATIFAIGVWITPGLNGTYIDYTLIRYNIWVMYMLLAILPVILDQLKLNIKTIRVIFLIQFIVTIFIFKTSAKSNPQPIAQLKYKLNFYPEEVQKIDSICSIYNIHYGAGNYWLANRTSMFSRKNIKIRSVYHNLNPHTHNANKNWYFDVVNKSRGPYFDFAVFKLSTDSINIANALIQLQSKYMKVIKQDDLCFIISSRFYYDYGRPFIIREDRKIINTLTFNFDTLTENKTYIFKTNGETISLAHYCKINNRNIEILPHTNTAIIVKIDSVRTYYDYRFELEQKPTEKKINIFVSDNKIYWEKNAKPLEIDKYSRWGKTYIDFKVLPGYNSSYEIIVSNNHNEKINIRNARLLIFENN